MINVIPYPDFESEFEVHAKMYSALVGQGLDVRGCVKSKCNDGGKLASCYPDIVVFKDRQAVCIVEVKNYREIYGQGLGKRQFRRYNLFGVPLFTCLNSSQIDLTVSQVLGITEL